MISIRRATADDADFLVELVNHADVEPFLAAVRAKDRAEILAEIERSESDPDAFGVFLIEVDGERAGTMRFERANRRSRIADLGAWRSTRASAAARRRTWPPASSSVI